MNLKYTNAQNGETMSELSVAVYECFIHFRQFAIGAQANCWSVGGFLCASLANEIALRGLRRAMDESGYGLDHRQLEPSSPTLAGIIIIAAQAA